MTRDDVVTGRTYGSSEPVVIRVVRRDSKLTIDDDGAAVRLAGRPAGWHERAGRIVEATGVNVNRRGVVFVPATDEARLGRLVDLVATASLEVYDALMDEH
jgi:hypothetical protein